MDSTPAPTAATLVAIYVLDLFLNSQHSTTMDDEPIRPEPADVGDLDEIVAALEAAWASAG